MSVESGYERRFFIFEYNECSNEVGTPSGFVKVIKEGTNVKVSVELSNVKTVQNVFYELIWLFNNNDKIRPFVYTLTQPENGKIIRTLNSSSYNIYNSGFAFSALEGFVISFVICDGEGQILRREYPLTAYSNGKIPWKYDVEAFFKAEKEKERANSLKRAARDLEAESTESHEAEETAADKYAEKNAPAEESVDSGISNINREVKTSDIYETLDRAFIPYDPFGTTSSSYKWWKARDMHVVNNVLDDAGINLVFELNKDGYIACEKFSHVLVGMYEDKRTKRSFFILGIPAEERNSAGDYYGNSRWEACRKQQSLEAELPGGYWLTYIDCRTSRVVKVK